MRGILIVLFISGFTGINLTRCKSVPIQEKEAKQIAELESVETDIQSSNLTPTKKAAAVKTIESAKQMVREQGQTITKQDAEISTLKKI